MTKRLFRSAHQATSGCDGESGMVTAFVVIMTMALLLVAGLVIDGGMILAAKRQAIDEAEAAARAGAQGLDVSAYRATGTPKLDSAITRQAAEAYLYATGDNGEIAINGDQVTVTVHRTQAMSILGIAGVGTVRVTGVGTAQGVRGVEVAQ